MMKAMGVRTWGGVDKLEMLEIAPPTAGVNDVLIRVVAASVNPADWRIREGEFKLFIRKLPFILGADVAGIVEQVGANVSKFKPGDAVYAMIPVGAGGGYAEYAALKESTAAHIPPNLTFAEAASLPLTALTALQALRDKANVQPGQRVVINGAAGGVGTFAVQIAAALGAQVTAVSRSANHEFVRGLGANDVIDYQAQDPLDGTRQYDVIFDCVNTLTPGAARKALVAGGVFLSVNPVYANPISKLIMRLGGRRLESVFVQPRGSDLEALRGWIEAGKLRPVIEQVYPLTQVAAAHERSATNRVRGKLVLCVDEALAGERLTSGLGSRRSGG